MESLTIGCALSLKFNLQQCKLLKLTISSWIQVQTLIAENALYKECTGKSAAELELMSSKAVALEVSLSALRFQPCALDASTSTREKRKYPVLRMNSLEIPGKLYLGK